MYTSKTILIILCVLISSFTCGWITGPDDEFQLPPPENLIMLTALFNETYTPNGALVEKLVLVDFNNPSNYKIVTDENYRPLNPKFSHDKSRIIFSDLQREALDVGPQFAIYDVASGDIELQFHNNETDRPVRGFRHVWDWDNKGIFYTSFTGPFSNVQPLYFFDLITAHGTLLHPGSDINTHVYPVISKDDKTIIVFSNDETVTNQPEGFYLMDRNGNYISRIDNPHLMSNTIINNLTREALYLDWNKPLEMIVYAEFNPETSGRKVSITNLDGSFYKSYTTGKYNDFFTVWGPDGETVLFERRPKVQGSSLPQDSRIMVLDIGTGDITEFVSPKTIGGAIGLRYPDY